jgi:regulator of protease activity HflC (stomatin/prohibitin superfamily)
LLLDRLEALLVESRQVPFTPNVIVDRDRCFDLINQMRVSIPEEVRKSKRVYQERDRIIAQVNEEAERIIALAREQALELVSDHQIINQVEGKAQIILERAQREAQEIRYGADDYALAVLKQLEERLIEHLNTVQNGILTLDQGSELPELPSE